MKINIKKLDADAVLPTREAVRRQAMICMQKVLRIL